MKIFFYKILLKLKLSKFFNFSFTKSIFGKEFKIPVIYQIGFEHSLISEMWMINILKEIVPIKPGGFFDVGVNTGQTLLKLKSVTNTMPYIGFEPNPKCIFYVDELIKANHFENCALVPIGLMNENAVLQLNFFSNTETDQAASLITNFRPEQKTYFKKFVPVFNYNTLNITDTNIAILKIDVEGAELYVIEALTDKIKSDQPIILMEILPCHNNGNTERIERQQSMESVFKDLNYKLFRILRKGDDVQLQYIEKIEIHSDITLCEYIIIPSALEQTILTKFKA